MKRLLLITLLSVSLISCNKESAINTEKSHSENQVLTRSNPGSYDHVIYNLAFDGYKGAFLGAAGNYDMANVFMNFAYYSSDRWYIERLGDYVKFWYQERAIFTKWRALDVDWNNVQNDGSINSVIYEVNGDPNQEWKLIGRGNANSTDSHKAFEGVLVNKKTGQMLEAVELEDGTVNVIANKYYPGSDEEWHLSHGDFPSIKRKYLWKIYRTPR